VTDFTLWVAPITFFVPVHDTHIYSPVPVGIYIYLPVLEVYMPYIPLPASLKFHMIMEYMCVYARNYNEGMCY